MRTRMWPIRRPARSSGRSQSGGRVRRVSAPGPSRRDRVRTTCGSARRAARSTCRPGAPWPRTGSSRRFGPSNGRRNPCGRHTAIGQAGLKTRPLPIPRDHPTRLRAGMTWPPQGNPTPEFTIDIVRAPRRRGRVEGPESREGDRPLGAAGPRSDASARCHTIVPHRSVQMANTVLAPWRFAKRVFPSGLKQAPAHSLPSCPG